MRKLKLQMQISVDGYVGGPDGAMDWMVWNWDSALKDYVTELTDSVDTILMGRKMTDGFMTHWHDIAQNKPGDPSYPFAKKMVEKTKVVFSKTIPESRWENTKIAKGAIETEVWDLKNQTGKDMIVYGGAGFVSSLIQRSLIDELYLFVNPAAIGAGQAIFNQRTSLELIGAIPFDCGIVLLNYRQAG